MVGEMVKTLQNKWFKLWFRRVSIVSFLRTNKKENMSKPYTTNGLGWYFGVFLFPISEFGNRENLETQLTT